MKITVDVDDAAITDLVRERIFELFSTDGRYRETGVRDLLRKIVDDAAVAAVSKAQDAIADQLPALAQGAVQDATKDAIETAAKRGVKVLKKLYAGFDPAKLTPDQRAWLEKQITAAANQREGDK
jgi:hypothetical protein